MNTSKSIFITGAASGIGRETARLFASKGWYVGIVDTNAEDLKTLEAEIGRDNCFSAVMDVTDPDSYQETVNSFAEKNSLK